MVKSATRRDTEILVKNPSLRLLGKKFQDSKRVKTNHAKTRIRDLSKTLSRFQDPAKIFPRTMFFEVPIATPHIAIFRVHVVCMIEYLQCMYIR